MKKLLHVFFVFTLFSLIGQGCTYTLEPTPKQYEFADVIFIGKVTDIVKMPVVQDESDIGLFTFEISEILKEVPVLKIKISEPFKVQGYLEKPCGTTPSFVLGKNYIVFASFNKASIWLRLGRLIIGGLRQNENAIPVANTISVEIESDIGKKILEELIEIIKSQLVEDLKKLLGPDHVQ